MGKHKKEVKLSKTKRRKKKRVTLRDHELSLMRVAWAAVDFIYHGHSTKMAKLEKAVDGIVYEEKTTALKGAAYREELAAAFADPA